MVGSDIDVVDLGKISGKHSSFDSDPLFAFEASLFFDNPVKNVSNKETKPSLTLKDKK